MRSFTVNRTDWYLTAYVYLLRCILLHAVLVVVNTLIYCCKVFIIIYIYIYIYQRQKIFKRVYEEFVNCFTIIIDKQDNRLNHFLSRAHLELDNSSNVSQNRKSIDIYIYKDTYTYTCKIYRSLIDNNHHGSHLWKTTDPIRIDSRLDRG